MKRRFYITKYNLCQEKSSGLQKIDHWVFVKRVDCSLTLYFQYVMGHNQRED